MSSLSEVYCRDCLSAMREMEDKCFDLAIVDPPYGIGVNSMNMGSRNTCRPDDKKWDDAIPTEEYFYHLLRVSANQIIWGGNYFNLKPTRCFVIWDKGETMYGRDFAECELAWTSFDKSAKIFKQNPVQLQRIHPTQKPPPLYRWLLTNYAKQGEKILDTHMGSQSSRIAAWDLGFDYVGYEIDEQYFREGCERFELHRSQQKLFTPQELTKTTHTQQKIF